MGRVVGWERLPDNIRKYGQVILFDSLLEMGFPSSVPTESQQLIGGQSITLSSVEARLQYPEFPIRMGAKFAGRAVSGSDPADPETSYSSVGIHYPVGIELVNSLNTPYGSSGYFGRGLSTLSGSTMSYSSQGQWVVTFDQSNDEFYSNPALRMQANGVASWQLEPVPTLQQGSQASDLFPLEYWHTFAY
ncbi:MAG: hypothetical protein ACK5QT_10605 [Oligoflexia bacterium]